MTPKEKKYLAILAVLIVLMFIWIFLAVFLTGGRETYDFTQTDKRIMIGFLIVEVITVILTFTFAVKSAKELHKRFSDPLKRLR